MWRRGIRPRLVAYAVTVLGLLPPSAQAQGVRYLDQGTNWTAEARARFYRQDQGSELIPLAWLKALRQESGAAFLEDSLSRYGYLPNPDPANDAHLPIGFTNAASPEGQMVGMTCSACHVRQIIVDYQTYRIDGGPAIADFGAMVADLDAAVRRVLGGDASFRLFADAVLGARASDETTRQILHAEVQLWWVRYHTLISRSLPTARPWGPTRLDAIAMIYNRLAGLDVGPAPTYLRPDDIQRGDAPTRYPFLWNAARQDITQWTGVAENGNDALALARSLSEIYGVFGRFHPQPPIGSMTTLNRDYLGDNSTSFAGLGALEGLLDKLGPPVWPWPVDRALAKRGAAIFDRPTAQGGCVDCHGLRKGLPRPPNLDTWRTPILDVGTDTRAWQVLLRSVATGSMAGAFVPGAVAPLQATDLSLNLLKASILGTIVQYTEADQQMPMPAAPMDGAVKAPPEPKANHSTVPRADAPRAPVINAYEARVLRGVWAAAPYLHNGSVPTLADLLKPAAQRPGSFKIGAAYDRAAIGLATEQDAAAFTLHATGCADRASGDSNCGHDYGTRLPPDDKRALLEYLKTL